MRQNRAGLPKSDKKSDQKLDTGEFQFKTSNTGLIWIKWMDKKPVSFLSNYHDSSEMTVVNRRQKDGSVRSVSCPVMSSDYNHHMGYVDYSDRLVASYRIDRK